MGKISLLILIFIIIFSTPLLARPQYAAKQGLISCHACHFNPTGAGPRTIFGKGYGSRGLGVGYNSDTDFYGADVRALTYQPIKNGRTSNMGVGFMNVALHGSAPITQGVDGSEFRAVGSYDIGNYDANTTRDLFVRYQTAGRAFFGLEHVVFGKFLPPFGLLTDEHRTYTKMQTKTNLRSSKNDGYDAGIMFSGSPSHTIHYDLSFTDGSPYHNRKTGDPSRPGTDINADTKPVTLHTNLNFRHKPLKTVPFNLGLSFKHVKFHAPSAYTRKDPFAYAAYFIYGGNRISLQTEFVIAQHMIEKNSNIDGYFVSESALPGYYNEIKGKKSLGNFTQLDFIINDQVTFIYKYDFLTLDKSYTSDAFQRHGPGLNYYVNSNFDLAARYERALVGRPGVKEGGGVATQDIWLVLAHVWL